MSSLPPPPLDATPAPGPGGGRVPGSSGGNTGAPHDSAPRAVVLASPSVTRAGAAASRRRTIWLASVISLALVIGAGVFAVWATRADTPDTAGTTPSSASSPDVAGTQQAASSDSAAGTATVPPPPDATSDATSNTTTGVATDAGLVDLGQAVRFRLPDGFTQIAVGPGVEITDGRLRFYAQVGNRPPGEDPLVVMQEYVNGFDALYASASYSQAVPRTADTSGVSAADGYLVYYRVMAADGTGYKGVIDATRRADGLVVLTDLYTPLDDASGTSLPQGAADELYASFLQTPVVGGDVALAALPVARLMSVHPSLVLDGAVVVTPPVGWVVEQPGPARVVVAHPRGERFVAARLADTADPLVAQDLAFGDLLAMWPGATISPFAPSREGGPVLSQDATFIAANVDGTTTEGVVRVWIDVARGQVFEAIASNITGVSLEPMHREFLFSSLDIALTQLR